MNLKWEMVKEKKFVSQYLNYSIIVETPSYWWIIKNEEIIDCCFYHPNIAHGDLQCKVQAQRAMDKILETVKLGVG